MPSIKHPFSAIPAERSSAPVLKIKLYLVLGALALAALLGPLAFFLTMANRGSGAPVTATVDYASTGYAKLVAEDFLSGRTTKVPTATGIEPNFGHQDVGESAAPSLDWEGLTLVSSQEQTESTTGQTYEVSKFVFLAGGNPMKIDVTMLKTDDGPVLASLPALRPADLSSVKYKPLDYAGVPGYESNEPDNQAVGTVVNEWAKAYATGDSKRLGEITGDPQPTGPYAGLGGFTLDQPPQILSYVPDAVANIPVVHGVEVTDPIYVRVRTLLRSSSAQQFTVSTDYDLLIFDSQTAQPKVVAWGAAGSAPLTPFSNSNRH